MRTIRCFPVVSNRNRRVFHTEASPNEIRSTCPCMPESRNSAADNTARSTASGPILGWASDNIGLEHLLSQPGRRQVYSEQIDEPMGLKKCFWQAGPTRTSQRC